MIMLMFAVVDSDAAAIAVSTCAGDKCDGKGEICPQQIRAEQHRLHTRRAQTLHFPLVVIVNEKQIATGVRAPAVSAPWAVT